MFASVLAVGAALSPMAASASAMPSTGTSAPTAYVLSGIYSPCLSCHDTMTEVDTGTGAVTGTVRDVDTKGAIGDSYVAVAPGGKLAYEYSYDLVSVINIATDKPVESVYAGRYISQIAILPDGTKAYTLGVGHDGLYDINTVTHKSTLVTRTDNNSGIALSPDGTKLYLTDTGYNGVRVYDTADDTLVNSFHSDTHGFQEKIILSADGSKAYVSSYHVGIDTITVLDTATGADLATVPVPDSGGSARMTLSPDGSQLYVTRQSGGVVTAISTSTDKVTASIATGNTGAGFEQLTFTPNGEQAYLSNQYADGIIVLDTATDTVAATIKTAGPAEFMAVSPDGKQAYTACSGSTSDMLSVINTATRKITATVDIGAEPAWVAFADGGREVLVPKRTSNDLAVIDTATRTVIHTVAGPENYPTAVAVSPNGATAYVAGNSILKIDLATGKAAGLIATDDSPVAIALTQDGSQLYAAGYSGSVLIFNTATGAKTASIPVTGPGDLDDLVLSPDGTAAYTANGQNDTVSVISTATHTVTHTIPVGARATNIAVSPDGSRVYVVNSIDGTISAISTATDTVTATIAVGTNPKAVVFSPDGAEAYVVAGTSTTATISVIDTSTGTIARTFSAPYASATMAITPDGSKIYLASGMGSSGDTVSVIDPTTGAVTGTITVSNNPNAIAFGP